MRELIQAAQRILCGATVTHLPDGVVEIISCERLTRIDTDRFKQIVEPLMRRARGAFLNPHGYTPPFNSETIITLGDFLEQAYLEKMDGEQFPRIKVVFLLNEFSGCSYWRCEEPARMLNELFGKEFYVDYTADLDLYKFLAFDVVVVQRGVYTENAATVASILSKLKDAGIKIVYEIDDDLDNLAVTNSVKFSYQPATQRLVLWLRSISDAIFCSTPSLKEVLGLPDKTYVLENSIDIRRYRLPSQRRDRNEAVHICWHGGGSHQIDLDSIEKELHQFLVTKRPTLQKDLNKAIVFSAFGYCPQQIRAYLDQTITGKIADMYVSQDPAFKHYLAENFPDHTMRFTVAGRYNVRYIMGVEYRDFHQALIDLEPDICICPLDRSLTFNASKSNIKWIESTLAGAACVVTEMQGELPDGRILPGPFNSIPDECVIKTRTAAQMMEAVRELILNVEKRKRLWEASYRYMAANYDLRINAQRWADALRQVANSDEKEKANGNFEQDTLSGD